MDTSIFFEVDHARGPTKRAHDAAAKSVCATCPVQRACLDWALEVGEPFGIWGGADPVERMMMGNAAA